MLNLLTDNSFHEIRFFVPRKITWRRFADTPIHTNYHPNLVPSNYFQEIRFFVSRKMTWRRFADTPIHTDYHPNLLPSNSFQEIRFFVSRNVHSPGGVFRVPSSARVLVHPDLLADVVDRYLVVAVVLDF